jgi:Cu(I)/Ag(I) efflux system membrane protein CusA/SilA
VLYERTLGGAYVDVVPKREALGRYGLTVDDVQAAVAGAIGGEAVSVTVEGRRRYTVNVRYLEDFRASPEAARRVLVPLPRGESGAGGVVPLADVAGVSVVEGPPMLRDEAGMLVGYVYVDIEPTRDLGGFVADARRAVEEARARGDVALAPGMYVKWTGQFELYEQMRARMTWLVPAALAAVALLLYLQFKHLTEVLIVLLSIPFAMVGSVWLLYLLDYRISTAVLVGMIALVGLAAQTGVVMIVYIDHAFVRRLRAGKIRDLNDIIHAHTEGTVQRVRPKVMTVATMLVGLVPLLWATGSGADAMKRIAAPMVGGLLTSAFLTLELIPVVYTYWRCAQLKHAQRTGRPVAEVCGIPLDETPAT